MGKGRTGNALPTELLPHLVEQIGFEPMTDNPMSSAHQKCLRTATKSNGQESDCGIARCAESCTTAASGGPDLHRYRRVHENHNLRPAEIRTDKKRTGNTCSTTELPRRVCTRPKLEPEAGLE